MELSNRCNWKMEKSVDYDHIISTMPHFIAGGKIAGSSRHSHGTIKKLTFRNTILVYLRVDQSDLFSDQWLYIHESSVKVGRVTNFRNWIPSVYGDSGSSILCLEYWCYFEDAMWNQDAES